MNASEQQNAAVESKLFFVFTDSASALLLFPACKQDFIDAFGQCIPSTRPVKPLGPAVFKSSLDDRWDPA